ncbi:MAG: hypothetical protein G01um101433_99 [Parcubacteria group bacterium Gr01-1014_33]|nr:MAG: hypothetical protein G01um101433_99 [Parcubacteria group bacterium Gr01-1014_33]
MIEFEKTYLAKYFPEGLRDSPSKEIIDIYIPKSAMHPTLRIRQNGEKYEVTKKELVKDNDSSERHEYTISLTKDEYEVLATLKGKRVSKVRYYYDCNRRTAEIGVFQEDLKGFVLIDFEFKTREEKNNFPMPDFCLADVTQEEFAAGGMLCGKSYKDIEKNLARFGYKKLFL